MTAATGPPTEPIQDPPARPPARGGLFAMGGLFGALAASSCCVLPLVLFSVGISGAWLGNLTALAPYQWSFVTITIAFLVAGFHLVYRKPSVACADGKACARPLPNRLVKIALWIATALVTAALLFPFVAPVLLGT
ncbi:MAG: mercuric transporter MerT family protein [Steroidobacteraceae bacterium]